MTSRTGSPHRSLSDAQSRSTAPIKEQPPGALVQACLPDGLQAEDGPPEQCIWSAAPSFSLAFPTAPQMWAGARCGLYELFWQPAVPLPLACFPIAPQPSRDRHILGGLQLGYLTKRLLSSHRGGPDAIPLWPRGQLPLSWRKEKIRSNAMA